MQSAARFAEQPGKGFIKARHALAALTTTHLQSIGLQSVDAGAQRRDPLVISPGKEIIIENNYLAVSVNAAGDLQRWTFSTQVQLRYKMAPTTVCIQRRLNARGPERKSVLWGKSGRVSVDIGGGGIIK